MKLRITFTLGLMFLILASSAASHNFTFSQTIPRPVLVLIGVESSKANGKEWTRYTFAVENSADFPKELFTPGANLPACGKDQKASRGRIDVYDSSGKRLNEFCAMTKSSDLGNLWFSIESDAVPPSYVYIELLDTQSNTKYKSNLAETVQ